MTVGSELKQAREHARLSPEEISERTKIQLYKIDALEKGDFELLPQGIYLDGIVRAYAHEVALDSERMVERVRLERGKLPGDWEVPFAAPIDLHPASSPNDVRVVDVPDAEDALGGFATEDDVAASPSARDVRHEPDDLPSRHVPYEPYLRDITDRRQKPAPEPTYVLDRLRATHMSAQPRRRQSNVAVPIALVLLALIGWGGYWYETNRRARSGSSGDLSASAVPEQGVANPAGPDAAASSNAAGTAPQRGDAPVAFSESAVSPDNDSERRRSSTAVTSAPASAAPGDTARGTSGRSPAGNASNPALSISNTRVQDARPRPAPAGGETVAPNPPPTVNTSAKTAAKPAPPARAENTAVTRSVPDVSGSWKLDTQVESSSLGRFEGLQLGYEMQLQQNGDRVTGVGRKVTENGGGVGSRAQTPISVNGTVSGDRLTLTFTEGGLQRPTEGKFVLLLEEDGTLRGRFSSNAARSSGRVEAHRVGRR